MNKVVSVAVIMTVYNRKKKTKKCITSILEDVSKDSIGIDFYITNDGSTDGTLEMIEDLKNTYNNKFIVINGTGNLFWNKGMYLSYGEALKS